MGSRKFFGVPFQRFLQGIEGSLIRFTVLAAVFLTLVQFGLGLATDPVAFYMIMAQKVEAPVLEALPLKNHTLQEKSDPAQTGLGLMTLKATPAMPVRVVLNGRFMGHLAKGELEFPIQAGLLQLDGSQVKARVRIQVIKKDPRVLEPKLNHAVYVEGNAPLLRISP